MVEMCKLDSSSSLWGPYPVMNLCVQ